MITSDALAALSHKLSLLDARLTWLGSPDDANCGRKNPMSFRPGTTVVVEIQDEEDDIYYLSLSGGTWHTVA